MAFFLLLKSIHTFQILKPELKTFQCFFRVPGSKFEANRSRGSLVIIGHTNKHHNRDYNFICILAWEPSTVKVTKTYSRRLPELGRFYRETNFLLLKSSQTWFRNSKSSLERSCWSPKFPNQNMYIYNK